MVKNNHGISSFSSTGLHRGVQVGGKAKGKRDGNDYDAEYNVELNISAALLCPPRRPTATQGIENRARTLMPITTVKINCLAAPPKSSGCLRCIEFALGIACAVFSGSLLDQPMGCRAKGTHHFKHEVHKLELAIPSNRPMRCRTKGTHGTKQRNSAST
eukprot:1161748-Pelagomonas_calceolata.AAC.5